MEKRLRVLWWDGSTIGHLVLRGPLYFAYDPEWIARGLNLSPISLPFRDLAFNGAKGVEGLPGGDGIGASQRNKPTNGSRTVPLSVWAPSWARPGLS